MIDVVSAIREKEQNRYIIGDFDPKDAHRLPDLFRRIYGEHYLSDDVYDPDALERANADGSGRSLVARAANGAPVGHLAILKTAPNPGVRELGQGVVDPDHRTQGLLGQMINAGITISDRDPGCCSLFGAALTNHLHSQRALWRADFVDVGFEIGYVPSRMMRIEAEGAGPTATVLQYRALDDRPSLVTHLPRTYSDLMLALYDQLHLTRNFAASDEALDGMERSQVGSVDLPRFDLLRLTIRRIGADLEQCIAEAVAAGRRNRRTMVQAVLALDSPATDAAVQALRAAGFWFGALLPRWMGADALLMQRALGKPCFDGIDLFTDDARALLRFVQEDAARQHALAERR